MAYLSEPDWKLELKKAENKNVKSTGISEALRAYDKAVTAKGDVRAALEAVSKAASLAAKKFSKLDGLVAYLEGMIDDVSKELDKLPKASGGDSAGETLLNHLKLARMITDADKGLHFVVAPGKVTGVIVSKRPITTNDAKIARAQRGSSAGVLATGRLYGDSGKLVFDFGDAKPVKGIAKSLRSAIQGQAAINVKVVARGGGESVEHEDDVAEDKFETPFEEATGLTDHKASDRAPKLVDNSALIKALDAGAAAMRNLKGKVPDAVYEGLAKEFRAIRDRVHEPDTNFEVDTTRVKLLEAEAKDLAKGGAPSKGSLDALTRHARELLSRVTGATTPDAKGTALASTLVRVAEAGQSISLDIKALDHLARSGDPNADETKAAVAAVKEMLATGKAKGKALGASDNERDAKRVPSEVLVHLLSRVEAALKTKKDDVTLKKLLADTRGHVLKHDLDLEGTLRFLTSAEDILTKAGHAELAKLTKTLTSQLPKSGEKSEVTRQQDNVYGRVFDSALIANLVEKPPKAVLKATSDTATAFKGFFENLPADQQKKAAKKIQGYLNGEDESEDPRFWLSKVPGLVAVKNATTPDNAVTELANALAGGAATGQDVIGLPWLMIKLSLILKDVGTEAAKDLVRPTDVPEHQWNVVKRDRGFDSAPWMKVANQNYQAISKAKSNEKPGQKNASDWVEKDMATDGSGITLRHQPQAVTGEGYDAPSTRPAQKNLAGLKREKDGTVTDVNTEAMRTALDHGLPYASGASGSTNIMLHLVDHLNKGGAKINVKDILVGTSMFLVADGGHSMQEVLYTANVLDDKLKLGMGMPGGEADKFVADYEQFATIVGGESGEAIQKATDKALARTTEYFEENSHYAKG